MSQTYTTYQAELDYMTDASSWLAVQNGEGPFGSNIPDPQLRYLHDGRGVSAFVHVDLCSTLTSWPGSGCSEMPGLMWAIPLTRPHPDWLRHLRRSTYHQLVGRSLRLRVRARWFQRFWVHRALRPEAYGGLVHYTKTAGASYPLHPDVLNSQAVAEVLAKSGTYFLPNAFPEGSPYDGMLRIEQL